MIHSVFSIRLSFHEHCCLDLELMLVPALMVKRQLGTISIDFLSDA